MRGPLCHTPSQRASICEPSNLPSWPKSLGPPEFVYCPYCGSEADEFCDVDYWKTSFEDYKKFYAPAMHGWIRGRSGPWEIAYTIGWHHIGTTVIAVYMSFVRLWVALEQAVLPAVRWQYWRITLFATAVLQELALSNIDTPLDQVRKYLIRHFDARHTLHPRLFEETVASVFRDFGYDTTVTAYSNDGGIDVVLLDENNQK